MRDTWYVLEDGTAVDPSQCVWDGKGNVLTHAGGQLVAMRAPGVPMSRGVDVAEDATVEKSLPKAKSEIRAEQNASGRAGRSGYKTRD